MELRRLLRDACLSIKELKLSASDIVIEIWDVSVNAFVEGEEHAPVVIVVELLFDNPERTIEVRRKLAEALGKAAKGYYTMIDGSSWPVEVAVKRFSPEKDAFWNG
ncbi:hypothetical protein HZB93_00920 [Candidatus Falkowbacteria bacterium]|nr:hypothetical protein [Candidatus Falkowbacteria bacterium]